MGDWPKVVEVKYDVIVTMRDVDDIVCTALEGGINYWCKRAEVVGNYLGEYASDQISRGGTLILYDSEGEDKYELTLDKLLKGIQMYVVNPNAPYKIVYNNELDTCQVDATVADMIIQFALFGVIVYGQEFWYGRNSNL